MITTIGDWTGWASSSNISAPKGANAIAAILKCCNPNGIPHIVMQYNTPIIASPIAIHNPASITQIIFKMQLQDSFDPGLPTIFLPKGHKAK